MPRRFKWTRPFRRKTKSGSCACAIKFQMQSTMLKSSALQYLIQIFLLTYVTEACSEIVFLYRYITVQNTTYTRLFISPSGISELDCATTKTDTAERSISIGRESLQVFLILGALAYFQVPPLGGSREEKWRSQ